MRKRFSILIPIIISFTANIKAEMLIKSPPKLDDSVSYYLNEGISHLEKQKAESALKLFLAARDYANNNNLTYELAEVGNWLGNTYQELGHYQSALSEYERALSAASLYDNELLANRLRLNTGSLHAELKHYSEALSLLANAATYFERVENEYYLAISKISLGYSLIRAQQYDSAEKVLNVSLAEASASGNTVHLAHIYTNQGLLYFETGQYEQARTKYQTAMSLFDSMNYTEETRDVLAMLVVIDAALKDFEQGDKVRAMHAERFEQAHSDDDLLFRLYEITKEQHLAEKSVVSRDWIIVLLCGLLAVFIGLSVFLFTSKHSIQAQNGDQTSIAIRSTPSTEQETTVVTALEPILKLDKGNLDNILMTLFHCTAGMSQKQITAELGMSKSIVSEYMKILRTELRSNDLRAYGIEIGLDKLSITRFRQLMGLKT